MGNTVQAFIASVILFYSTGQPYDIFSNTTQIPVRMNLNGQLLAANSTEAVFQGLKRLGSKQKEKASIALIQDRKTPLSQLRSKAEQLGFNQLANQEIYNQVYDGSGLLVKEEVMYQLLLAKSTQHLEICKALLDTKKAIIVENTHINHKYNDEFWGNGHSKKGHNGLGKAWMRVRDTLNSELNNGGIPVRVGISNRLASTLGLNNHITDSQLSGKIITRQDLQSVKAKILVSDLHKNKNGNNMSSGQVISFSKAKAKGSAANRVMLATGAIKIDMVDDINIYNQKVLRLTFKNSSSAYRFSKQFGNAPINGQIVYIGPKRAENIFQVLNISMHGKTNPRPMWKALRWELS